jgi:hypothetical protein
MKKQSDHAPGAEGYVAGNDICEPDRGTGEGAGSWSGCQCHYPDNERLSSSFLI